MQEDSAGVLQVFRLAEESSRGHSKLSLLSMICGRKSALIIPVKIRTWGLIDVSSDVRIPCALQLSYASHKSEVEEGPG